MVRPFQIRAYVFLLPPNSILQHFFLPLVGIDPRMPGTLAANIEQTKSGGPFSELETNSSCWEWRLKSYNPDSWQRSLEGMTPPQACVAQTTEPLLVHFQFLVSLHCLFFHSSAHLQGLQRGNFWNHTFLLFSFKTDFQKNLIFYDFDSNISGAQSTVAKPLSLRVVLMSSGNTFRTKNRTKQHKSLKMQPLRWKDSALWRKTKGELGEGRGFHHRQKNIMEENQTILFHRRHPSPFPSKTAVISPPGRTQLKRAETIGLEE